MKEEVNTYEDQLLNLTTELANDFNLSFPQSNLPSFNFTGIGSLVVDQLKDLYKRFITVANVRLRVEDDSILQEINDIHCLVKIKEEKLCMLIETKIGSFKLHFHQCCYQK